MDKLEDYPLSSNKAYPENGNNLVNTEDVLLQFSKNKDKVRSLYQKFIEE